MIKQRSELSSQIRVGLKDSHRLEKGSAKRRFREFVMDHRKNQGEGEEIQKELK